MLEHLSIHNFAIISDLDIDFNDGFLVLTGETGAGKSIIIDALNILTGERSSSDKIRTGTKKAHIEGVFRVQNPKIKERIEELLDEELEEDLLILSRSIDLNGKSTLRLNGHSITLAMLKQVAPMLLDIHSQQKDEDYLKEEHQLSLLDQYAKNQNSKFLSVYKEYQDQFASLKKIRQEMASLQQKKESIGTIDDLLYQKNELDKINLQPHEMEDLEEEKLDLSSFSKLTDRLQSFIQLYSDAHSSLYQANKELNYLDEDTFGSEIKRFSESYYELEDVYQTMQDKMESYEQRLNKLEAINTRLFQLHSLRKKYGYTSEEILSRYAEICQNIDEFENFEHWMESYQKQEKNCLEKLSHLADELHELREEAARKLENNVQEQLQELYLQYAEFKVDFMHLEKVSSTGMDKITFLLKANAGSNFISLSKNASLGETSRLNLALKTVFNNLNPKETIIFDEIDIGVSGRVATAIAKKMKKISLDSQVICISHLPQVSAGSDHHYYVYKEVKEGNTYSSIRALNQEERIIEIARMLSGEQIDEASKEAARALVKSFKE